MKRFEYRTEKLTLKGDLIFRTEIRGQDFNNLLNDLGAEGWELVSSFPIAGYNGRSSFLWLVFKKEITE